LEVRTPLIRQPFVIIWEFRVSTSQIPAFLRAYGSGGPWTQLFSKSAGYLGTELLRDEWDPHRFVTQDRWVSAAAYEDFQWHHQAAYEALDHVCEPLAEAERRIGVFGGMAGAS
jgi:heme-degrading monooxygenase HmoA